MGCYAGLDIGSCTTKAVVINDESVVMGSYVCRSGIDYVKSASAALNNALAGISSLDKVTIVSTGYGRHSIVFATDRKTEIACHAKGAFASAPKAMTLVDIGGQDNKVIRLDDQGRRIDFKMNRKCAAGTGTFIEEIANRMDIPLASINEMARKAKARFKIGSYCTVFACTEILAYIRAGASAEELVRGVFESVTDRIIEMLPFEGAETVVLCGGVVEYYPFIADLLRIRLSNEVIVPPRPQLTGAYGAALFARKVAGKK
jgi:predicted CoA-substrate-specific enzyme activase